MSAPEHDPYPTRSNDPRHEALLARLCGKEHFPLDRHDLVVIPPGDTDKSFPLDQHGLVTPGDTDTGVLHVEMLRTDFGTGEVETSLD